MMMIISPLAGENFSLVTRILARVKFCYNPPVKYATGRYWWRGQPIRK